MHHFWRAIHNKRGGGRLKYKRVIGCDENECFVIFELDSGVFATVAANGKVRFSAEWLHHAKLLLVFTQRVNSSLFCKR